MSDKNITSPNKEIKSNIQNKLKDSLKQNKLISPKHNNSSSNLQSLENTEINQRNFPSKANFFGKNKSRVNNLNEINKKYVSPRNQSPVINYFSSISPKLTKMNQNYSPEQNYKRENNKQSPLIGGNMVNEQAFNYSPSNIFNNNPKNNNNNYNMLNNYNFNNHQYEDIINNKSNNKTLAEKIEHLVGKNEDNNLMIKSQNIDQKSEDEDEDGNDEMYLLTLNICDDKENEEELNKYSAKINEISNQMNQINNNNINFNNLKNINKTNNPQFENKENNLLPKPLEENINNVLNNNNIIINKQINNFNNEGIIKSNNEGNENKNEIAQKILTKGEMPKPYIPNKYRNNIMEINQINSFQNDNMLPSYSGPINDNVQVNSYTINNNINNNFNINNIMNQNNPFQIMNEKVTSPYPMKIGEFLYQNNQFNPNENNKFGINNNMNHLLQMPQNDYFNNMNIMNNMNINTNNFNNNNIDNNNNYINNFFYKGDNYQINQFKQYKKKENLQKGQFHSICADDFVTTITANNKKIKRIDPNAYLNESLEYLSFNIIPLAKDQAGCRFLQEKLEKEPKKATNLFFNAILPNILIIIKDPFGNYFIQKLCNKLNPDQILKILEKISPTILDIGANNHGTRVIQHLINFLTTKELIDYFLKSIEPFVIPLLKELNGTHIIQQLLIKHPECASSINKIIVENCASLASHSHGCCVLQKFLIGNDKNLKESLINNLINNCLILIIDQYGNYVIQSILLLNDSKSSSAIAMKIYDNVAYYSKHRYSSNVVEKCFDFCGENERKKLVEKLSPPDVLADLIMDEHGNYVVQKALSCSEANEQEIILKNIIPLIPKIKNVSFGEKLLSRLMSAYPQFKNYVQIMEANGNFTNINFNQNFNNYNNNYGYNDYKKDNKKKKGNKNNNNNNKYFDNNFYNDDKIMNNKFFNKNQNMEKDGRSSKYGNNGKAHKNRGNKKNYKNWRDLKDEQKNKNNIFNNNESNNSEN